MRGIFVVLEGSDGSGKSTVVQALKKRFKEEGIDFLMSREPGGTPIAEKIRHLILDVDNKGMDYRCEALLYAASRADHSQRLLRPAVEEGKLVLSERYIVSSLAYQGVGRELGIDQVLAINSFATKGLEPDLVLFLDVDPIYVLERKGENFAQDRLEQEGHAFHQRVYEGYKKALSYVKNVVVIDGTMSKEEVVDACYKEIMQIWEKRI